MTVSLATWKNASKRSSTYWSATVTRGYQQKTLFGGWTEKWHNLRKRGLCLTLIQMLLVRSNGKVVVQSLKWAPSLLRLPRLPGTLEDVGHEELCDVQRPSSPDPKEKPASSKHSEHLCGLRNRGAVGFGTAPCQTSLF